MRNIPFNVPFSCSESSDNLAYLITNPKAVAEFAFSIRCIKWFEDQYPGYKAYLTTSCTRSLELVALAMDIQPGDEVIIPSYTYVGVADAFANYGAELVFLDLDPETMNLDAGLLEQAITSKTKAIVAMHYGAVRCEIEKVRHLCDENNILLVEDNAHGIGVQYNGRALGSYGDFSCISFDRLKNISIGEGGVLLCRENYVREVDIAFEKGTNKTDFLAGNTNSYEWVSRGSNFSMSEHSAAILYPLLLKAGEVNSIRRSNWKQLYDLIASNSSLVNYLPSSAYSADHNGHIFFLKFDNRQQRDHMLSSLKQAGVPASFHYTPLHSSSFGKQYRYVSGQIDQTLEQSGRLLRLPMHNHLDNADLNYMARALDEILSVKI